jgi:hypothetical protein
MRAAPAVLLVALLASAVFAQPKRLRIGDIEFYGYAGINLESMRARLAVHEGDEVTEDQIEGVMGRVKQALQASGVEAVCCDAKMGLTLYIGLRGKSARDVKYDRAPKGDARLPDAILTIDKQFSAAFSQALSNGATGEDQSKGYALSVDPALRKAQMAMRHFATGHEGMIVSVLESSSDAGQRALAARLVGYARQSPGQIAALVRASRDPDAEVRNNASRALWVLAGANRKTAARIPAPSFVEMLYSRAWTDRNKASLLLEALTRGRDAKLLADLRTQAREPLIEMARWRDASHANPARLILGRCAGIEEDRLQKIISAGDPGPILEATSLLR